MSTARKTAAAKPAAEQIEAAARAGQETVEAVMKAGGDAVAKTYEHAVTLTREQVEKAGAYAFGGYDELAEFSRDNLDAWVAATGAVTRGVEDLGKQVTGYTRQSFESGVATAQKMFAARNLQELVALQSDWARESFDAALAETTRWHEQTTRIAQDVSAPLNDRVTAAIARVTRTA